VKAVEVGLAAALVAALEIALAATPWAWTASMVQVMAALETAPAVSILQYPCHSLAPLYYLMYCAVLYSVGSVLGCILYFPMVYHVLYHTK
jgi:hypothetical protein